MQRIGINRPLMGSLLFGNPINRFLDEFEKPQSTPKYQKWELVYDPSGDFELYRCFTQDDVEFGSQGSTSCWSPNTWFRNVKTGVFLEVKRSPWRFDCLNIVKHK
jgi:hypothetical protein